MLLLQILKCGREKTSGLRDIGLLDDERNITEAGLELLRIADSANFSADNFLEIPKDSFLYFKQMLKTANVVEGKIVRPFVVFLYAVNELGYLTNDEFTYLLPLCVDEHPTKNIVKSIKSYRGTGEKNFDDIILSVLMEKDNYKQALNLLKTEPISEELICNIGINRKSAKYDKPYYTLYPLLKKIVFSKDNLALEFYEATKKLTNSKVGGAWRKYFFNSSARSVISREGISVLNACSDITGNNRRSLIVKRNAHSVSVTLYGIVFVLLLVVSAVSLIVYIYKSKIGIYVSIACLVIIFAYGIIMKDSPLQLIIIFLPVIYAMFSTRE